MEAEGVAVKESLPSSPATARGLSPQLTVGLQVLLDRYRHHRLMTATGQTDNSYCNDACIVAQMAAFLLLHETS